MTASQLPASPKWRGINHLALVTPDMDATVRFYAGVLDMPLVMTLMAGPMRHYFFEMSPHNTVAFFEVAGAETFQKAAGSPAPHPVQLDHLSFDVPDLESLDVLRRRLLAAGSDVTEVVDHDVMKSVYFTDPNGIALEASVWIEDGTGREFDPADSSVFLDPDPVPAVAELAAGALEHVPTTHLV